MEAPERMFEAACAALSAFDADALIELCAPDVEFSSRITGVDRADYRGAHGIRAYIANLSATFEWMEVHPTTLTGAGDRWVTLNRFRARGRGSGVQVEQTFYQAIRLRGGRGAWWGFYDSVEDALRALDLDQAPPTPR